ncbi:hypothetical protein [Gordonia rubripertincta]|uniref:Uncharacterized protein n=1 Tax=Gordonia rubripertincta TaxID=36822 RepID=A0ABT4N315_GORRU|nr:hypothetical protein [Gordonia rubripertincta]MCZ4553664.1 hypothetical protein [Gordonia rubripertincta]
MTTTPHTMDAAHEERMVEEDRNAATNYFAGPFCGCGDYSCPASADANAPCVNQDDPGNYAYGFDAEGNTILL